MKVTITKGKFDLRMFAQMAIFGFFTFILIVGILFIGVFGISAEKLFKSSFLIISLIPIINAATNAHLNRKMTITVSNCENPTDFKTECEDLFEKSGFKSIFGNENTSVWQFASLKKILFNMHRGTTTIKIEQDTITITAQKTITDSMEKWLKKVKAKEINNIANS